MKHQILLYLSVGVMFFFALLNVELPHGNGITGAATEEAEQKTYAFSLSTLISRFFNVEDVIFPVGSCSDIASDIYSSIAYKPVDTTVGFSTNGKERLATINFIIDRQVYMGTMDLISSPSLLGKENADGMISFNTEAAIHLPHDERTTYFVMDLYGNTRGMFVVNRGRFSTPSADCAFVVNNGKALCDCKTHTISGIKIGGITAFLPSDGDYDRLYAMADKR